MYNTNKEASPKKIAGAKDESARLSIMRGNRGGVSCIDIANMGDSKPSL